MAGFDGPPRAFISPKDAELFFGLFDGVSGYREMAVSRWLLEAGCDVTRCIACVPLTPSELETLGIFGFPVFKDGRPIEPVVLVTRSKSPLRVCDFTPARLTEWRNTLDRFFGRGKGEVSSDPLRVVRAFARHLASTIICYQALGAVNDTLAPDNVTAAGEITDFEWIFVPGIPLPDGTTDVLLDDRQRKEAFYFIDVMIALCEGLEVQVPRTLSQFGLESRDSPTGVKCGFYRQLTLLAN